jgi:hypothetical protein
MAPSVAIVLYYQTSLNTMDFDDQTKIKPKFHGLSHLHEKKVGSKYMRNHLICIRLSFN